MPMQGDQTAGSAGVDRDEVERFDRLAAEWWASDGPMAALHKLNPTRLGWIRTQLVRHFGCDERALEPFAGLAMLDAGCGGGLLCEPLARLGAGVTGIDLAPMSLDVARAHARSSGLEIEYRQAALEDLLREEQRFDVVLALEVVEHVPQPEPFLDACARLVRPGGGLVVSTLNRTPKAFAFGIVGAEYVLRWLPRGTHDWRRFLRPSEVARPLRQQGFEVAALCGTVYDPLRDRFRVSHDLSVNYMLFATRTD